MSGYLVENHPALPFHTDHRAKYGDCETCAKPGQLVDIAYGWVMNEAMTLRMKYREEYRCPTCRMVRETSCP
jgi:hypothetical protein